MISHEPPTGHQNRIDDYFWKIADLTGQDLFIRQFCLQVVPDNPASEGNPCNGVWLAYVKLVPLNAHEVEGLKQERQEKKHKRLFAHHDAWSYTYSYRPTTAGEIQRELEPFWNTDFARLYWEGGMGDRMYYPTRLGIYATDDWIRDPYRVGDRLASESWQAFKKNGIDPFRTALEYTHRIGMEFHGTYRPAGFHFPVPEERWDEGGLYDRHPEWRGQDRSGRPTPRLSYAYPEVRKAAIALLKEMAAYPVDGICIAYNRRPPLLEYEAPIIESFKARYGKSPKEVSDDDPQWLAHRATVLTQFMREVREAMEEVARQRKTVAIPQVSVIVMSSEAENLYYGIDLRVWIKEQLVDTIIPYTSVRRLTSAADSWTNPNDARFFLDITKGSACKLALNMMPRQQSPEEYRRRAYALYEIGVDYLFFCTAPSKSEADEAQDLGTEAGAMAERRGDVAGTGHTEQRD
ncbi:MAG: hypothetical protein FJW26_20660, partial [Acidimicrobiia bacterium]|nr:hypothetical protein [Acidimicrobiia bacterium]